MKIINVGLLFLAATSVVSQGFARSPGQDTMEYRGHAPVVFLYQGQGLQSLSCYYHLDMQSDGNLVTYAGGPSGFSAVWSTGTHNTGAYATLQSDGNFVIYNWSDAAQWASGTNGRVPGNIGDLVQQDDGNLVLYSPYQTPAIWSSNYFSSHTYPGCPGHTVSQTYVYENSTTGGHTFQTISSPRSSWCGYYCATNPSCKAWVQSGSNCFLEDTVASVVSSSGVTAGFISTYSN